MNHPPDDAINAAWNELASGHESDMTPGMDTTDAALLRAMHATAAGLQPSAAFRDQLWADLSRRPVIANPAPSVTPSLPASSSARAGVPTVTPRLAPSGRRWSPPIATIAAALVIALVGYGALSLSGTNPSGLNLNLNEVPNASAQGQGMARTDNPVVGTWAWLDDSLNKSASSFPIVITMTLDSSGGVTASAIGDWTGHGTWSTDGTTYSVQFSVLVTQEALERWGPNPNQAPNDASTQYIPNIHLWSMTFTLSEDQNQWDVVTMGLEYGVQTNSAMVGSNNPMFFVVNDLGLDEDNVDGLPIVRRLESIIESAPTISAEDAGFESGSPDSSPIPAVTTVMKTPGPSATPTTSVIPTEDADVAATVKAQATTTILSNQESPSPTLPPAMPTVSP